MRHDVRRAQSWLAPAPAPRARGVGQAATAAALVALRRLASRALACRARAGPAAVELAAVAAAAQHHRHATARAHEPSARRLGQVHAPRQENTPPRAPRANADSVWRWTQRVRQCNTGTAPAASPRGVGHGAAPSCQAIGSRPVPACDSGHGRRSTAPGEGKPSRLGVGSPVRTSTRPASPSEAKASTRLPKLPSPGWPPCRAATQAKPRSAAAHRRAEPRAATRSDAKTAASPPNKRGS